MINSRKNKNFNSGIFDISNEEYHASEGISRSALMEFNKTPFHYWNSYINPNKPEKKKPTESMNFGNLIHTYILEKNEFDNRYLVSKKMDKRTKAGSDYYKNLESIKGNRIIITEEEFLIARKISESLLKDNIVNDLIEGAQYEKSMYWEDIHTGLICKVRPDIWHDNFIVDLKTCSSANMQEFQKSLFNYGYYLQAGMIHEALLNILNKSILDFIYIVIEKEYPYAHAIYKLDAFALEKGIILFKNKLLELKNCYEKNEWPSYQTKIVTLPNYANFGDV